MENILVIGAGGFQLPLVQAAAKRYRVVLAAPIIPNDFLPYISDQIACDVRDQDSILSFARSQNICGVVTDQTDIAVRTVAYVAEQMGLPGIGYETSKLFTDKSAMRRRLQELDIPQLPNRTVETADEAVQFHQLLGRDVIIKPLDTQGSRGVYACSTPEDIVANFPHTSKWSSDGRVIVEQLAKGREFYVEGVAYDHQFQNLMIGDTDFFDIPGVFAARTRIAPTNADQALRDRVLELNERIVNGFGLSQGITHSEFIVDDGQVYLLETAARGGGVFISSDQIALSTGLDVENFLLDIATGMLASAPAPTDQGISCGYMAFYLPPGTVTSIEGISEVVALPYTHRHQLAGIHEGLVVQGGPSDKTSRYAITVSAANREELLQRMNGIRDMLRIRVRSVDGSETGVLW